MVEYGINRVRFVMSIAKELLRTPNVSERERNKKVRSILLVDIPEMDELGDSRMEEIVLAKWAVEDLILGETYAQHMGGQKYSRGLLTMARELKNNGITPHYITIDEVNKDPGKFESAVLDAGAVGIEGNVTAFFPYVEEVARKVKQIREDIPVIVGGSHVTFRDVETLGGSPHIDVVVRGEGEAVLTNLLEAYPNISTVRGITYKDKDCKIVRNPNRPLLRPEEIPIPDYEQLGTPLDGYSIRVQGSRGCVYTCEFCEDPVFWKRRTRLIPAETVLSELDLLRKNLSGNPHIHFIDSIFTLDEERTRRLLGSIINRGYGFSFSADIRTGFMSKNLVRLMENAGFKVLLIGLEDPSQPVLDSVGKRICFDDCLDTIRIIKDNSGIKVIAYWMIGLPGSTHETLNSAVIMSRQLIRRGLVDLVYSGIFVPVPGTPIFEHPEKHGIKILTRNWSRYLRTGLMPVHELPNLSAEEIYNYHLLFETSNLMEYCAILGIDLAGLRRMSSDEKNSSYNPLPKFGQTDARLS